jgi:hypothetical protein
LQHDRGFELRGARQAAAQAGAPSARAMHLPWCDEYENEPPGVNQEDPCLPVTLRVGEEGACSSWARIPAGMDK